MTIDVAASQRNEQAAGVIKRESYWMSVMSVSGSPTTRHAGWSTARSPRRINELLRSQMSRVAMLPAAQSARHQRSNDTESPFQNGRITDDLAAKAGLESVQAAPIISS